MTYKEVLMLKKATQELLAKIREYFTNRRNIGGAGPTLDKDLQDTVNAVTGKPDDDKQAHKYANNKLVVPKRKLPVVKSNISISDLLK